MRVPQEPCGKKVSFNISFTYFLNSVWRIHSMIIKSLSWNSASCFCWTLQSPYQRSRHLLLVNVASGRDSWRPISKFHLNPTVLEFVFRFASIWSMDFYLHQKYLCEETPALEISIITFDKHLTVESYSLYATPCEFEIYFRPNWEEIKNI